jgi:hypothetical protein
MAEPGERKGQAAPSLAYDPVALLCKYMENVD